jgi:hypothetical protein
MIHDAARYIESALLSLFSLAVVLHCSFFYGGDADVKLLTEMIRAERLID